MYAGNSCLKRVKSLDSKNIDKMPKEERVGESCVFVWNWDISMNSWKGAERDREREQEREI